MSRVDQLGGIATARALDSRVSAIFIAPAVETIIKRQNCHWWSSKFSDLSTRKLRKPKAIGLGNSVITFLQLKKLYKTLAIGKTDTASAEHRARNILLTHFAEAIPDD